MLDMADALAWLAPRRLSPLRSVAADGSEQQAGRYEGLLEAVHRDHAAASDLLQGADGRAAALLVCLPTDAVVVRRTALWVHTARPPGPVVQVARESGGGCWRRGMSVHVQHLCASDVDVLGAAPVTTPLRTACDLVRHETAPVAVDGLGALRDCHLVDLDEVERQLRAMVRAPGSARGATLVAQLTPRQAPAPAYAGHR